MNATFNDPILRKLASDLTHEERRELALILARWSRRLLASIRKLSVPKQPARLPKSFRTQRFNLN